MIFIKEKIVNPYTIIVCIFHLENPLLKKIEGIFVHFVSLSHCQSKPLAKRRKSCR